MSLQKDWIIDNNLDFEYKKYILLAYFQEVKQKLHENKLYPTFSEVYNHYIDLVKICGSIMEYDDSTLTSYLNDICDFAIIRFEKLLKLLQDKIDEIESKLFIVDVGIEPINKDFGFILISNRNIMVYEYDIKLYEVSDSKCRGISMDYLKCYKKTLDNTFENIKLDMIKEHNNLKNPSTIAIINKNDFKIPYTESIYPISKLAILRYLAKK